MNVFRSVGQVGKMEFDEIGQRALIYINLDEKIQTPGTYDRDMF